VAGRVGNHARVRLLGGQVGAPIALSCRGEFRSRCGLPLRSSAVDRRLQGTLPTESRLPPWRL
jgi:hypothetical protein